MTQPQQQPPLQAIAEMVKESNYPVISIKIGSSSEMYFDVETLIKGLFDIETRDKLYQEFIMNICQMQMINPLQRLDISEKIRSIIDRFRLNEEISYDEIEDLYRLIGLGGVMIRITHQMSIREAKRIELQTHK
jgi:hypothetical protein